MNTYQLKLDLNKGPTYSVGMAYSGITLRQGDKRGCTVVAELYDHGTRFTEAGYTAYFVMGLPDREHYYREAATYNAGTATIIIDESLAASVAGDTVAYFELTKGGATYSTQGIKVSVLKDARADKTPGETYDSRIEQAIEELQEATANIPENVRNEVDAQLAAHPEWTTTVQDGSITYPKLASSLKQRLNNKLHRLVTAPVVTASDAYAAPPVSLVVDGKSVQDGTPAPDAPVAIQSVESVGLAAAGVNLLPNIADWRLSSQYTAEGGVVTKAASSSASWQYAMVIQLPAAAFYGKALTVSLDYRSDNWTETTPFTVNVDGSTDSTANRTRYTRLGNNSNSPFPTTEWQRWTYTFTISGDEWFVTGSGDVDFFGIGIWTIAKSQLQIRNVQLELGSTATPYVPYVGSTTPIPLQGHALRSLPDGTRDEVNVDEWGHAILTQRVGSADMGTLSWTQHNISTDCFYCTPNASPSLLPDGLFAAGGSSYSVSALMCTGLTVVNVNFPYGISGNDNVVCMSPNNPYIYACDADSATAAAFKAAMSGITLLYKLAEPQTIDLGYLDPALLPAPDLTAWASCTPATEIGLDYERDVTIAVERIEAAIAELATN